MKHNKLTITAALALLIATCISCADSDADTSANTSAPDNTAAVTDTAQTAADPFEGLEIRDFGGEVFHIVGQNTTSRQNFYFEELEGDLVNDALHDRDRAVEERLNITLEFTSHEDRLEAANIVQRAVNAGEETYDMVITALSQGINTLTTSEMLYDLREIPYLTLDSVYWNKSMYNNMHFFGKQYFTTSPISAQLYVTPIVMIYNKRLAEDLDLGNIYQTVLDGKWTVELLSEMMKDFSSDLNSDGKMDENDQWGLVIDGTFGGALYTGAGLDTIARTEDAYTLTLDSAQSIAVIDKCSSLFGDRNRVINDLNGDKGYAKIFREGRALFMDYTILGVTNMRDMDDDFGIIPCPKFDEAQETYYTACNTYLPSGIGVPMLCSDPEGTGLIMETMARASYDIIVPAIYERTLNGKVARDDESSLMLDIIFENASFDFNTAFDFNGTAVLLRQSVTGDIENFVSKYTSKQKAAQKQLDQVVEFAKEN
ncbi:MAG: hypothetical protein IJ302_00550 [Clostridia bacterium]|nr:hypothetical protein [Clostridia bacterium]